MVGLKAMNPRVCRSHGDLHPRNIFVRKHGFDVILIDFASTRYESPLSADPAMLDVALSFDVDPEKDMPVSQEILRQLYTAPLTARELRTGHHRVDAIHLVRRIAL